MTTAGDRPEHDTASGMSPLHEAAALIGVAEREMNLALMREHGVAAAWARYTRAVDRLLELTDHGGDL